MFINVSPFRINISPEENFLEFLNVISHSSREMLKHQKYSYNYILEDVRKMDPSTPSLYNIVLSYQITKANKVTDYNFETRWAFNGNCNENLEIQLYDLDETGELTLSYDYKINKYTKQDIKKINERLFYIINQVLEKDISIKNINITTEKETKMILNKFNNTKLKYNKNIPVIQYFEEQVKKNPKKPALTFHNKTLSFSELNEKANSLAHIIAKNTNSKNAIIPIMSYRSFEVIIGILAILKAGCAYLPIDPDYPEERIEYILSNCKANILLTQKNLKNKTNFKNIIEIDLNNDYYCKNKENLDLKINPEDLSYLIYTSGSTGLPKGVKLTQKNYTNFYNAMLQKAEYLKNGINYSMISITTISFDIFGFETLISLMCGVHLFLTDNFEQKDTSSLEEIIKNNNIDAIQTTPSVMKFHLENLKNKSNFSNLKYFILAGEQLPKELVQNIKKISPNATIYNGYGPSETTIFSTFTDVTNVDEITIGKPIANTDIYILNSDLNLLPPNTIGEIYIAGDGVGNGYLNRNDLTQKAFIKNPFNNGIMYKTGDIGLWSNDGNIYCKGRNDNQIKLRGLRIELGEIEYKINTFKPNISINSVVVLRKINNKDILHTFITSSEPIDLEELKIYLLDNLPNYMVPSSFSILDKFPKTPNGKIDKKALPQTIEYTEIINPPITETQKIVCSILEKLLKIQINNIDENIFNLGTDSLIAIQLITEIKTTFNKKLIIRNIFENNTINLLSKLLDNTEISSTIEVIEPCEIRDFYPISSLQEGIYYSSEMASNPIYNMTGGIEVFDNIDTKKIESYINKLVERHEAFRTSFELVNGEIVQKIHKDITIVPEIIDGTNKSKNQILNNFNTKFDLSKAPLIKAGICKLENKHYLILISMHHIIADGTSFQIFISELCKLYNDEHLEKIQLTYKDYAKFEKEHIDINSKNYWITKFNKDIKPLNLPTTYNRPSSFTYNGAKTYKNINKTLTKNILDFCNKNNITPFMFMISVYYILLYKYSDNEEILVGTPVSGRDLPNVSNIIGMFVNTLVLDANIDNNLSFSNFCKYIKQISLEAFKNQNYSFNELIKNLEIKRDLSRNPLFDVLFTYQNNGMPKINIPIKAEYFIPDTKISKFDLSLEVMPTEDTMELNFEYCTDLFSKEFINDFSNHYIEIIKNVLNKPTTKIKDLQLMSDIEKNKIIYEFNKTSLKYPKEKTISELFEEQVLKTPDKIAVIYGDTSLTYSEINSKANNLAHFLLKYNIKNGDVIGILLNRSCEVLISMLAILKLGAAYVPIDPTYPEHRVKYILENSNTKILLSEPTVENKFNVECDIINVKLDNKKIYNNKDTDNLDIKINSESLAYVIYTSGSTRKS